MRVSTRCAVLAKWRAPAGRDRNSATRVTVTLAAESESKVRVRCLWSPSSRRLRKSFARSTAWRNCCHRRRHVPSSTTCGVIDRCRAQVSIKETRYFATPHHVPACLPACLPALTTCLAHPLRRRHSGDHRVCAAILQLSRAYRSAISISAAQFRFTCRPDCAAAGLWLRGQACGRLPDPQGSPGTPSSAQPTARAMLDARAGGGGQ